MVWYIIAHRYDIATGVEVAHFSVDAMSRAEADTKADVHIQNVLGWKSYRTVVSSNADI